MNNEKMNQMIDEAYENYNNYMSENFMETRWCKVEISPDGKSITGRRCNRNEFIIESKTQLGFSEKWGLRIEERELSSEERYKIWFKNNFETGMEYNENNLPDFENDYYEPTPTRLITITYNNETIEVYE
jgi:hypothetical protein